VEELRQRFNDYVRRKLGEDGLEPERVLDAEISLNELTDAAVNEVLALAPFGLGNRTPVFLARGVRLASPPEGFGKDKDHLRLTFDRSDAPPIQMKAWRFSSRVPELPVGAPVDVALTVESDLYSAQRGGPGWSATVRDVRPGSGNHDQTNSLAC
jgi:single-stranded-DNA-specific exonuclease